MRRLVQSREGGRLRVLGFESLRHTKNTFSIWREPSSEVLRLTGTFGRGKSFTVTVSRLNVPVSRSADSKPRQVQLEAYQTRRGSLPEERLWWSSVAAQVFVERSAHHLQLRKTR